MSGPDDDHPGPWKAPDDGGFNMLAMSAASMLIAQAPQPMLGTLVILHDAHGNLHVGCACVDGTGVEPVKGTMTVLVQEVQEAIKRAGKRIADTAATARSELDAIFAAGRPPSAGEVATEPDMAAWPKCNRNGCAAKMTRWANTGQCYPHSVEAIGQVEMDRRYQATRGPDGKGWNGKLAAPPDAPDIEVGPTPTRGSTDG